MKSSLFSIAATFLVLASTVAALPASAGSLRGRTLSESNNDGPVNCGGHSADKCEDCPFDYGNNFAYNGANWCHGDCVWESDAELNSYEGTAALQCRRKVENQDVDCGYYREVDDEDRDGVFRPSCHACLNTEGSNANHCGGDCQMDGEECIERPQGHPDGTLCDPSYYACSGCLNPATEWYPFDFRCGENPEFGRGRVPPGLGLRDILGLPYGLP